ncbi:hypothetical protein B0A50_00290 [Salinomyces thailandicus]|uniref:Uncharacterized protein n=1 Tax=Salinomyces thailandicus TaxID=706561 RepID=A0A4U0UFH4_9PEZI|nr:hypothetical protein B0A50_00290 [Salinomyces thailandica]
MAASTLPPLQSTGNHTTSDLSLQPFLADTFDPADYLNTTLPSLSTTLSARTTTTNHSTRSVPLSDLTAQLQSHLSHLNAQTTRLSNTLNQLTDEIIRSGGRLAYEVEVLRGETSSLTDTLTNGLRKEIELFSPSTAVTNDRTSPDPQPINPEPEYLINLKRLTAIRHRLSTVIELFGAAMSWPLPPSELSTLPSSLVTVSNPSQDTENQEQKAQQYISALRNDIHELLNTNTDEMAGLEAAVERIEDLRGLAEVWRGTAEEKARFRVVEGLARPVEERQRVLERSGRGVVLPARGGREGKGLGLAGEGGGGFLSGLRRLREDIYVE